MTGFQNPYMSPYGFQQMQQMQQSPMFPQTSQQVVKVNGENGARAYQIGPNSSALLLDESGLLVWVVTSDGAGYKTVSAYDISPHKVVPKADFDTLENRIKRLEDIVSGSTVNSSTVGQKQYAPNAPAYKADDEHGKVRTEPAVYAEPVSHEQSSVETGNGYRPTAWGRSDESTPGGSTGKGY